MSESDAALAAFSHCRRDRVAVLRHQHLRQRAHFRRRCAGFAGLGRRRIRRGIVCSPNVCILGRGLVLHLGVAEEQVEGLAQRPLFILVLGERQQQRVAQDVAVGKSDIGHRFHGIDAFRGRYPNAGSASRPEKSMQFLSHQCPVS